MRSWRRRPCENTPCENTLFENTPCENTLFENTLFENTLFEIHTLRKHTLRKTHSSKNTLFENTPFQNTHFAKAPFAKTHSSKTRPFYKKNTNQPKSTKHQPTLASLRHFAWTTFGRPSLNGRCVKTRKSKTGYLPFSPLVCIRQSQKPGFVFFVCASRIFLVSHIFGTPRFFRAFPDRWFSTTTPTPPL